MSDNSPTITFADWLRTASAGDSFCYFTGFLADSVTPVSDHERAEANAALEAFRLGKVELAQRRLTLGVGRLPGTFQYEAQLRRQIRKPLVYGVPWVAKLHSLLSRGAVLKPEKPLGPPSRQDEITALETVENQGLQEPESDLGDQHRELAFEQINEVTWKLTDGVGTNAWRGNRGGSYRTTRALAWLMGVGNGKWIVRHRNKASRPMRLAKARDYALEMVRGIWAGPHSPILSATLHQTYLKTMGKQLAPQAPLNLMGVCHQWHNPRGVDRGLLRRSC